MTAKIMRALWNEVMPNQLTRLLAALISAVLLFSQDSEPTLGAALAKIQAQDFAGAAAMLESVTKREPNNGRAFRNLGLAYDRLKQPGRAIDAYRRALEVQPEMVTPMFNIAAAYAAKGDADRAVEWLAKAKATRKIDMTQIEVTPEFGDARYQAFLPTRADFENPFVEKTQVIREWDGESSGDQFGWIARAIGDVDGDGVPDFVTSAPTRGRNAGRVYVYSTKSGKLLWSVDGNPGDQLGLGIEAAGDTNRDGIPDVVASAPGAGKAYIYSGKDGRLLVTMTAESKSAQFGRHVSGAGDVNHDGFADVMIGAPGANAAYVYSGRDGKLLWKFSGDGAFGSSVAGFTGKKTTLLMVGAPAAGPAKNGRAYVYSGLGATPKFVIDPEETGHALGAMFLAIPGDLDGDGFPDVFASDWADGASSGRVYLHSWKDGHRLFTIAGKNPGEGLGTSASVAGDVDGDGRADLIVGAWQYSGEANSGGRAYLYSGKDGSLLRTYTDRIPGDTLGFDAVGIGDADGDGTVDFLITAAWSGIHGFHSGRMFVISSGVAFGKGSRRTRAGKP
ncbi:MAG: FG-GAP-like repeat-containing protein [Acidobacteriia bacterium]|nr:FG-GAP-like repeat-containing protein [Terriglobia bacterium]